MKLKDLFADDLPLDAATKELSFDGLVVDCNAVKPGSLFFSTRPLENNRQGHIDQAIKAGAVAIVADRLWETGGTPLILLPNYAIFARAAARIFSGQPETVVVVTGTSGKTSVSNMARHIFAEAGRAAASNGTAGLTTPEGYSYTGVSVTTPNPVNLYSMLRNLRELGVTHLVMEASSHGLDWRSLVGARIAIGAFTNLSPDHLDYHGTFEHYRATKLRLFRELVMDGGAAVIGVDGPYARDMIEAAASRPLRIFPVGRSADGQGDAIQLVESRTEGFRQVFRVLCRGVSYESVLPLAGAFQLENALIAAGIAVVAGEDPAAVFDALKTIKGAKGRLEKVAEHNGASIFVDYAHNPAEFGNVLRTLRQHAQGRLLVVFGAGGDRDPGKRKPMGAMAVELADRVFVTDENPRFEDAAAIRAEILSAARGAIEIGDRGEAIRTAVDELGEGDILLVAGKGHETAIIIEDRKIPFSDHEAIMAAVALAVAD